MTTNNTITNQTLDVADLDFSDIKRNLRVFLESQDVLNDYNFSGSAIDVLMDAYAYITHYNAFNANLSVNESFLDSSQLRSSVVSHAKLLGYTPRSASPARAELKIRLNNPNQTAAAKTEIELPAGHRFSSTIGNITYPFVTTRSYTLVRGGEVSDRYFENRDGENISVMQGVYVTDQYIYDDNSLEAFELSNADAVTSTLEVVIQNSETDTTLNTWKPGRNLTDITPQSRVYYLDENRQGLYEITFGDNIMGRRPDNGNIIFVRYVATERDAANQARTFTSVDRVETAGSNSSISVISVPAQASGGRDREDIRSIKFNAPLQHTAQNRAVTPNDYRALIQESFANIDAISVWGGEDNDPPDYGKVFISISPSDKETLTQTEKDMISNLYVKPKNIVSITPVFVDPSYTYIDLDIYFRYNPNVTSKSASALQQLVRNVIDHYDRVELRKFDGVFRNSNIKTQIDNADPAIISSTIHTRMKKRFVPEVNVSRRYDITFSSPIVGRTTIPHVLSSNEFLYRDRRVMLRDRLMSGTGRVVQIVQDMGSETIVIDNSIGTVDAAGGTVSLIGFRPGGLPDGSIELTVIPASDDLAPRRNELLRILTDEARITGSVDTMITGGTVAGIGYNGTPRQ